MTHQNIYSNHASSQFSPPQGTAQGYPQVPNYEEEFQQPRRSPANVPAALRRPGGAPHSFRNRPRQKPRRRAGRKRPRNVLLAGGGMLALAALVIVPKPASEGSKTVSDVCQQRVHSQSVLSRGELSKLLSVPERSARDAVRQVVEAPYCTLSPVELREGVAAEREAYPLAFDPQTWLIVLYEDGEYAGYDFSFYRE